VPAPTDRMVNAIEIVGSPAMTNVDRAAWSGRSSPTWQLTLKTSGPDSTGVHWAGSPTNEVTSSGGEEESVGLTPG